MLCRMSSEFLISISPGCIATTCGMNLQPFWSTTALVLVAPLAPGTETTALARPLLPPTTTFSITASVPHFSVSLLTFSFSTWGAPLYFTSASMVPPPWAPACVTNHIAAPATSASAVATVTVLRIAHLPPAPCVGRFEIRRSPATSPRSVRRTDDEDHGRQREDCHDGRNDETPIR